MLLQMQCFIIFMAQRYSTVYGDHIFFIYASADGNLGGSCISAIGNNIAVNTEVHIWFLLGVSVFF